MSALPRASRASSLPRRRFRRRPTGFFDTPPKNDRGPSETSPRPKRAISPPPALSSRRMAKSSLSPLLIYLPESSPTAETFPTLLGFAHQAQSDPGLGFGVRLGREDRGQDFDAIVMVTQRFVDACSHEYLEEFDTETVLLPDALNARVRA